MSITGAHVLLYTPETDALRAVWRDVFEWRHVDAHDGWLIFALPPAELGVHPGETTHHELALMCADIRSTVDELRAEGIAFTGEPEPLGFGIGATMVLPGGVHVMGTNPDTPSPSESDRARIERRDRGARASDLAATTRTHVRSRQRRTASRARSGHGRPTGGRALCRNFTRRHLDRSMTTAR